MRQRIGDKRSRYIGVIWSDDTKPHEIEKAVIGNVVS